MTLGYVPCCPTNGCYLGANLWSTGWLDNNHPRQRPEDKWLGVECWQSLVVCRVRKGQGKSMGSIRCTQIPSLATISPLFSWPTGRSENPHRYQYCCIVSLSWFSQPPMLMNLCSMFRFFLCHDHVLSHLPFTIMMILLTVSLTLVHYLHTLYCYLFLANWSVCCPALNFLVYN